MSTTIQGALLAEPEAMVLRLDIANAFSCMSRSRCLQLCRTHQGEAFKKWEPYISALLAEPLIVPVPARAQPADPFLRIDTGLPQGDPLSALAFGCAIAHILEEVRQQFPEITVCSYEIVFVSNGANVCSVMHVLSEKLAACGLQVQSSKTQLWYPASQRAVAMAIAEDLQCDADSKGMTICGLSLYEELLMGCGAFIETFLASKLRNLDAELREVIEAQEELGAESGLQTALALLRCFLPGKVVHLLRGCSWAFTQGWSEQLDSLLFAYISELIGIPQLTAKQKQLLVLLLEMGGAGLPSFACSTLACRATAIAQMPDKPWLRNAAQHMYAFEMQEITTHLASLTEHPIDTLIRVNPDVPHPCSPRTLQKKLLALCSLSSARQLHTLCDSEEVQWVHRWVSRHCQAAMTLGQPERHRGMNLWPTALLASEEVTMSDAALRWAWDDLLGTHDGLPRRCQRSTHQAIPVMLSSMFATLTLQRGQEGCCNAGVMPCATCLPPWAVEQQRQLW